MLRGIHVADYLRQDLLQTPHFVVEVEHQPPLVCRYPHLKLSLVMLLSCACNSSSFH